MPRFRIAFARVAQETNCLSPVPTTLEDFRQTHFVEGDELMRNCQKGAVEAPGFLKNAELSGFVRGARERGDVELLPMLSAWAVPSGPLERACFESIRDRLVAHVERLAPLDAVYLCLHGAMGAKGLRDPEADLVDAVKRAAGGAKIAVSYDLHGNLTRRRMQAVDLAIAYATNPHRDFAGTGRRTARLLMDTLTGRVQPTMAWRSLPILLGGGNAIDIWAPMAWIFHELRSLERRGEVLSASVLMCHPWNDDPDLGWGVIVITDNDQAKAETIADRIADRCWAVREVQPLRFLPASEAIAVAQRAKWRRKLGVITLSDVSDVVAAGAPGDNTRLLRALLEEGRGLLSYVPLRDPAAIERLWDSPVSSHVDLEVGGTLDPELGEPLRVQGTLQNKRELPGFRRQVVLAIDHVRLVITEGPALVMKPSFYGDLGLDVWKADVVVVKSFFPFRIFFLPHSRKTIYVKTKGRTDLDAAFGIAFADRLHPIHRVEDWRQADRRRHGGT